jgi:L,D-peptidoglycan transpeptidase YkuD (ErfK/YbiS/YcfS/YnhG family)
MKSTRLHLWLACTLSLSLQALVTGCSTTKPLSLTGPNLESRAASGAGTKLQSALPSQLRELLPFLGAGIPASGQAVLVANAAPKSHSAKVYALERNGAGWQLAFDPIDAVIGGNGFAAPGAKREGDKMTPAGIYPLERAFGYDRSAATRMPYRQVTDDDIWVDDPNSGQYNQLVKKAGSVAASYEKMKRDDPLYRLGIVVEYNTNPVKKGYGSAIFFHLWGGPDKPTSGCIAMSGDHILELLDWLDPARKPSVVMGTDEMIRELLKR